MKKPSLKLNKCIYSEMEQILMITKKSQNEYINEAIASFNKEILAVMLIKESNLVKRESMKSLKDFESLFDSFELL